MSDLKQRLKATIKHETLFVEKLQDNVNVRGLAANEFADLLDWAKTYGGDTTSNAHGIRFRNRVVCLGLLDTDGKRLFPSNTVEELDAACDEVNEIDPEVVGAVFDKIAQLSGIQAPREKAKPSKN